jgi:hypothetical protein
MILSTHSFLFTSGSSSYDGISKTKSVGKQIVSCYTSYYVTPKVMFEDSRMVFWRRLTLTGRPKELRLPNESFRSGSTPCT